MINHKKTLGQHFLHNKYILNQISSYINLYHRNIIEIGPGTGNLTEFLLKKEPTSLICIEIDRDMVDHMTTRFSTHDKLHIIHDNCLKIPLSADVIISNLPYNISSKFFYKLLVSDTYKECVFLLQKEFAQRMLVCNNVLGWMVFCWGTIKKRMIVKPNNFTPAPRVDSMIITMQHAPKIQNLLSMNSILRHLFQTPRKKLRYLLDVSLPYYDIIKDLRPQDLQFYQIKSIYEYEQKEGSIWRTKGSSIS